MRRLDAVGSATGLEDVEPSGWTVALNRVAGVATVLLEALLLALAVLE